MTPEDRTAVDKVKQLFGTAPHKITPREGFNMMFKRDRVPWTGEPLGPPYLHPLFRAGLERQGYDADEYAAMMEAKFRADGIWPED